MKGRSAGTRDEEIIRMVGASKHRRKVWRAEGIGGKKHITIKNFKERDKLRRGKNRKMRRV